MIENHTNQRLPADSVICAKHRYVLGVKFRPNPKICSHPKCKKETNHLQYSTYEHWTKITYHYGHFLLRGLLCKSCRTNPVKDGEEHEDQEEEDFAGNKMDTDQHCETDNFDIADFDNDSALSQFDQIYGVLKAPKPQYKLSNCTNFSSLSSTAMAHAVKSYQDFTNSAKMVFLNGFMPEKAAQKEFLAYYESLNDQNDSETDLTITQLINLYKSALTAESKFAILTIAVGLFKKSLIMEKLECTRHMLDKAVKIASTKGPCSVPDKNSITRHRIDRKLVRHFYWWLAYTGTMPPIVHRSTSLKFDCGLIVEVPAVVLTGVIRNICRSYLLFCEAQELKALSLSSLERCLKAIKAVSRKKLTCVDNFLVAGENAIDCLIGLTKAHCNKEKAAMYEKRLRVVEHYIKSVFPTRCCRNARCASHCMNCATSDPQNRAFSDICTVPHSETCPDCVGAFLLLDEIGEELASYSGTDSESVAFDFSCAKDDLLSWISHVLISVLQDESQKLAFQELEEGEHVFFWLSDWAMKFLPTYFHESQFLFFGKKGFSIHIDVFLRKINSTKELQKFVYITIIQSSNQNLAQTMRVSDIVVKQFKMDHKECTKLLKRSDNASCYSGNGVFDALHTLTKKHGIELVRNDNSAPQNGKSFCDSVAGNIKTHCDRYVRFNHNISNPSELKEALLWGGGLKNAKVAVVEIDPATSLSQIPQIRGISKIHAVSFSGNIMR